MTFAWVLRYGKAGLRGRGASRSCKPFCILAVFPYKRRTSARATWQVTMQQKRWISSWRIVLLDSGGEEDIDEDPAFPLPSQESEVSGDSNLEGNKKNKRKYNRT